MDLGYMYKGEGVTGTILCTKGDSLTTLLIKLNKKVDSLKNYKPSYSLASSLEEDIKTRMPINPLPSYFQYEDRENSYYGLRLNTGKANYFVLWLYDTIGLVRYPIIKQLPKENTVEDLVMYRALFNSPVISSWLPQNTVIRLGTISGGKRDITVKFYDYHFRPAPPPMTAVADSTNSPFEPDQTRILVTGDTINLAKIGLYHFSLNGNDRGQSMIVMDKSFPKTSSYEELIKPLRYLATEEEYLKMTTSFEKKEFFDKFWLNNTKSEEKARVAVREYFNRVQMANVLFSTYKEGWKTDKGMIYIIFGAPSSVFIKDQSEMWIYNKSFELPRLSFTFEKIDTAFSDQYYVLVRKAEYQNLWFRAVDLWRSGNKEY